MASRAPHGRSRPCRNSTAGTVRPAGPRHACVFGGAGVLTAGIADRWGEATVSEIVTPESQVIEMDHADNLEVWIECRIRERGGEPHRLQRRIIRHRRRFMVEATFTFAVD